MQVIVHLNTKVCDKRKISPEVIMETAPKKIRDRRHYRDFEYEIKDETATIIFSPKNKESYQNLFQLADHVRHVAPPPAEEQPLRRRGHIEREIDDAN